MRTTWYYQLQYFHTNAVMARVRGSCRGDASRFSESLNENLNLNLKLPPRQQSPGASERRDELLESFLHEKTTEELFPYSAELLHRLNYVDLQLSPAAPSNGGAGGNSFLCGDAPTYADVFMAVLVAVIEAIVKPLDAAKHANILRWRRELGARLEGLDQACRRVVEDVRNPSLHSASFAM